MRSDGESGGRGLSVTVSVLVDWIEELFGFMLEECPENASVMAISRKGAEVAVSYTHLTLPTIYSV